MIRNIIFATGAKKKDIPFTPVVINNKGTIIEIRDIAYGNGIYVAVGSSTVILKSSDGKNWDRVPFTFSDSSNRQIVSVNFLNGKFIATAFGNFVLTSTDGVNWSEYKHSNKSGFTYQSAYGNGIYMVVGIYGLVLISNDGINWQTSTQLVNNGDGKIVDASNLRFIDGAFYTFATTTSTPYVYKLYKSVNGINWSSVVLPTATCIRNNGIMNGNGLYIIPCFNGVFLKSTDLINWELYTPVFDITPTTLAYSFFQNGKFYLLSNTRFYVSTDGINWKSRESVYTYSRSALIKDNMLIIVGNQTLINYTTI